MNIEELINKIILSAQNNRAGTVAAGIIFLFLLIRKPKLLLWLLFICIAGVGVAALFETISGIGIGNY